MTPHGDPELRVRFCGGEKKIISDKGHGRQGEEKQVSTLFETFQFSFNFLLPFEKSFFCIAGIINKKCEWVVLQVGNDSTSITLRRSFI